MITLNSDIIPRINKGDLKAFEELYTAYYVYLRAVATKYIYQVEAAQEIVNDVFVNVWHNHQNLNYPVQAYLLRAVQNRCLNYLQRKRSLEISLSDVEEQLFLIQEQQIGTNDHPLSYLENKEFECLINKAVNKLPPKCRTIFEQYLYQNKSYNEIAEINQIAPSTVRVQIKLGLSKIKEELGKNISLL